MQTRECPDCEGSGTVTLERDCYDSWSGHRSRKEQQECETCNGYGEVPDEDEDD